MLSKATLRQLKNAVIVLGVGGISAIALRDNSPLGREGRQFRDAVLAQLKLEQELRPSVHYDLTPLCQMQSVEGRPLADLQAVLRAAGGEELIDVRTTAIVKTQSPDYDYFANIGIVSSPAGSSELLVQISVDRLREPMTVKKLTHCRVINTYL